jgi:hypothetical protein
MADPVYLTDANDLIYLYKAGGLDALNAYSQSSSVAVTDQVKAELQKAPNPQEGTDFASL